MRYILDSEGYIEATTFGGFITCNNNTCTEYTGSVPSGYETLEEWNTNANIRAYKIENGNLVYDSDRDTALQELWQMESKNSQPITIVAGTWTPVLNALNETAPTVEYTFQQGNYRKIGDMVFIDFYVRGKITALNGTNNYAVISGLPFPKETTFNPTTQMGQNAFNMGQIYAISDDTAQKSMYIGSGGIRLMGNGAIKMKVTTASYFLVCGSGFYFTD